MSTLLKVYHSTDVQIRKDKIKAQIKVLENQKVECAVTLEKMRPLFVEATTSGDSKKIEELQKKTADLKAKEAAIDTQIEFLYKTPIVGSSQLFDAANKLNDELEESGKRLRENCKQTKKLAEEQKKFWEKIESDTQLFFMTPFGILIDKNTGKNSGTFAKAANHYFSGGKCIERTDAKDDTNHIVQQPSNTLVYKE